MGHNNIIELNGKQYDAITGALLGESRVKATPMARTAGHQGRVVDGFIRKQQRATTMPHVIAPTPVTLQAPAKSAVTKARATAKPDIQRPGAKIAKAHQPERAKTLMRHAVSKPKASLKPAIKTTLPSELMAKPASELTTQLEKKRAVTQVDPVRLARAGHIARSHHIRKFSKSFQAVQAEAPSVATVHTTTGTYSPRGTRPMAQDFRRPARPQMPTQGDTIVSRSVALEQAQQRLTSAQTAADMFEEALIHAASHEEPAHKPSGKKALRRRRLVSAFAGVAAFLVIGGFVAYLNMPGIELRVASMRAGFHAEMPSYKPIGYALDGGIKASKGGVELTYRSGDSSYTITQVASDWNSATLLDQNIEQRGTPTHTIQSEGRIIYIYNDTTASWVNGGIRYEITSNANLNSNDLVALATSI